MSDDDAPILVYTTFASEADARRIGGALVETRLAACVNIFPNMVSIYEWQGKLDEAGETAMLIKSRKGLQDRVLAEAKRLHPYDTPALLVLEIGAGDSDFCGWIATQTKPAAV